MDNKYLLDKEEVITQSDGKIITLTNLRLRYSESEWGKAHIVSLLLEKISSIEVHYRSLTMLVILAVLAVGAGLFAGFNGDQEFVGVGFGAGIILMIFYLVSRKHYLTIVSDGGGKVHFHTKGMNREKVLGFVNQVESAIIQRREKIREMQEAF